MGNAYATPPKEKDNSDAQLVSNINREYDIFKDSWIRYTGYTNEVGEAFRRHIPYKVVVASYAIATTYVCADTIHKGHRSYQRNEGTTKMLTNAGDAFVWQMFASVIVPGYVINRITYFARRLVRLKRKKCICKASPFVRYSPIAIGLIAIPFIIHPIDESITWIMDNTLRKLYNSEDENENANTPNESKRVK